MASNQTANLKLNQWLATDAVLRSDFNADNQKIDSAFSLVPRIVSGTYRGTGVYGPENPRTLNFTFTPLLVIITADSDYETYAGTVFIRGQEQSNGIGNANSTIEGLNLHVTWGEKSVSWYTTSTITLAENRQMNRDGQLYHYFALGLAS